MADSRSIPTQGRDELAEVRRLRTLALTYASAAAAEPDYHKRRKFEQTAVRLWSEARRGQYPDPAARA
jgi:hypothetical protein